MISLDQQHPDVAKEIHNPQSRSPAIDQAHEHNNAVIKDDGDAIWLTENKSELRRWIVAGPEVSGLVARYEAMSSIKDATYSSKNHEQTLSAHKSFFEKVKSFSVVM